MRILGIDPGLRRTGFGVIDVQGMRLQYVASGTIVVPTDQPLAQRLKVILDNIREIVQSTQPTVSVLEKVFVNTNPASTLLLGQARGAAMCALADSLLDVHEYTALQVKKAVVGNGHAAKEQVQRMVQHLLSLSGLPAADSADALACAICHAHSHPLTQRLKDTGQLQPNHTNRVRGGRLVS
ncbi:MAG TPA: crossover junction endodeoxyribonuclease RuvC [Candidimonas sp.]|nr:crossover junction endodeoxyribonuclease RuvC [Candidimonas sp.]